MSVLLASASRTFEERVRRAFGPVLNGALERASEEELADGAHRRLAEAAPSSTEVLAVGPDVPLDIALELAELFDRQRPGVSVVLFTPPTPDVWERAMRSGVRDVVAPEASDEELRNAIDKALEGAARRRTPDATPPPAPSGPKGRVISVVSPKGGAGKTAIAANLGVALAAARPGEVLIIDLDLQFGDMTDTLGLQPDQTFYQAARTTGLDLTTAKIFLTPRRRDLFVLCAPGSPAEGEEVTAEQVTEVVGLLATEFPFVVIDTAAGLDEHTLSAMEISTDLVLVCDLARSSIRSMRKVVEALDQLGMTAPTRRLILNRAGSRVGVDESEVVSTVGMRVDVGIPSSRSIPLSMNEGVPIVESNNRSPVARKFAELAGLFAEISQPASGGLFGRFTG